MQDFLIKLSPCIVAIDQIGIKESREESTKSFGEITGHPIISKNSWCIFGDILLPVGALFDNLWQRGLLDGQEWSDLGSRDWDDSDNSSEDENPKRRWVSVEDTGDDFEDGTDDESFFSSNFISLGCQVQGNDDISENDCELNHSDLFTCEILELEILDHNDGDHSIREHTEGSGEEEQNEVRAFYRQIESHYELNKITKW